MNKTNQIYAIRHHVMNGGREGVGGLVQCVLNFVSRGKTVVGFSPRAP